MKQKEGEREKKGNEEIRKKENTQKKRVYIGEMINQFSHQKGIDIYALSKGKGIKKKEKQVIGEK